jgi:hypothetical protein
MAPLCLPAKSLASLGILANRMLAAKLLNPKRGQRLNNASHPLQSD